MNRVRKNSPLCIGLYCIIMIVLLYIVLIYLNPRTHSTISSFLLSRSSILTLPSEELCYASEYDTFPRDHLRPLVIQTLTNTSCYANEIDISKQTIISSNFTNLADFIVHVRKAFVSLPLRVRTRPIPTIFHRPPYKDMVKPSCDGLWMEFGVFRGASLTLTANWKATYCNHTTQPVYGFDTFQGLPTNWRPGFGRGKFDIGNKTKLKVPNNTVLVKGLFIDTLPGQLRTIDRQYKCHTPVSFVHIDCDIYDGARDVLFLLSNRFVKGSIIVFDELFNYPDFEKHEIKALYEFLIGSNLQLIPLGANGPIHLMPKRDNGAQAFAFVVAS